MSENQNVQSSTKDDIVSTSQTNQSIESIPENQNVASSSKTRTRKAKGAEKDIDFNIGPLMVEISCSDSSSDESGVWICPICNQEDPPRARKNVNWIGCDQCDVWAHDLCLAIGSWLKIRSQTWICPQCSIEQ